MSLALTEALTRYSKGEKLPGGLQNFGRIFYLYGTPVFRSDAILVFEGGLYSACTAAARVFEVHMSCSLARRIVNPKP